MQCATIEYARDAAGLKQADSTEFDPQTPHRVIYKLRELLGVDEMGGTMRLGAWPCKLEPGSFAHKAYGKTEISERHRHRYEFNREYEKILTAAGLRITGTHSRRELRGNRRGAESSVVPGLPVPSGVQVQATGAASAVRGVHWGFAGAQHPEIAPHGRLRAPPNRSLPRPPCAPHPTPQRSQFRMTIVSSGGNAPAACL